MKTLMYEVELPHFVNRYTSPRHHISAYVLSMSVQSQGAHEIMLFFCKDSFAYAKNVSFPSNMRLGLVSMPFVE